MRSSISVWYYKKEILPHVNISICRIALRKDVVFISIENVRMICIALYIIVIKQ